MKKRFSPIGIVVLALLVCVMCGCSKTDDFDKEQNSNKTEQSASKDDSKEDEQEKNGQGKDNQEDSQEKNNQEEQQSQNETANPPKKSDTVEDPNNDRGLSTERFPFSFGAAKDGKPHSITVNNQEVFDSYDVNALAWDNKTSGKVLYLTFDCGYKYENLTERILDTLKEKNVKAAFFCTLSYLKEDAAAVQRMIEEGHIVGNHSTTHPDCTTISRTELAQELKGVDDYMKSQYGIETFYFRFPTGAYSRNSLDLVNSQGYRSIFWSIAHSDWDPENQPGVDVSFQTVTERLHPGAVILLHSTSPDNADILADYIDYARNQGYEFRSLDEYQYWN